MINNIFSFLLLVVENKYYKFIIILLITNHIRLIRFQIIITMQMNIYKVNKDRYHPIYKGDSNNNRKKSYQNQKFIL